MKQLSAPLAAIVFLMLASCTSRETGTDTRGTTDESRPSAATDSPPARTSDTPRAAATSDAAKPAPTDQSPGVNPDAKLLVDFKERLDKYISVRKSADDHTPPLKKTNDPGEIKTAQDSLGKRIGDLNVNAKHGDIFTPEIAALFKRLLHPEVADKGTREAIHDDNPGSVPYLKVNAPYPDKEPLSTVPANVLAALPKLPDDVEYRFVGKNLILRDVRANLIVDYIPNAIS